MTKTFSKGGVHPPENKLSAKSPIETLAVPKTAYIPVSQHAGKPAKILVKRNQQVKTGELIAESSFFISANIHSPVSGKVKKIDSMLDASGYRTQTIVIETQGDEWADDIDTSSGLVREIALSPEEIIEKVKQAGIVGLGGATFPANVKLTPPEGKVAEVLLINGVECEPYLTADHRLMLERGDELMVGIQLIMKALGVKRAAIGIEKNKPDAIEHLTSLTTKYDGIEVVPLKVKYPQGGEKQLIKAVLGREVPSAPRKLPIDVGAVVHNVGTAVAIYEAVQKNKPLIERVVTVTGKSVSKPSNFLARIGTPVSELIQAAGGLPDDTGKIISGGPMMGKALSNTDVPMVKGMSGVLILPRDESKRRLIFNCIRCSKCISVCPMGLEPYLLMTLAERAETDKLNELGTTYCIECGSCSYTCPSNRPLLDYIRLGKNFIRTQSKK